MQTQILCSIYDSKAQFWSAPRMFRTKMDALRAFESAINSGEGYGMHPEDFALFQVGEFNEWSGIIDALAPEHIESGVNLLKEKNQ